MTTPLPQVVAPTVLSTDLEAPVAAAREAEESRSSQRESTRANQPGQQSGDTSMHITPPAVVRDEAGASTAEYATVTGVGVGFAAVLFKFLTSEAGQALLELIFNAIKSLLPF